MARGEIGTRHGQPVVERRFMPLRVGRLALATVAPMTVRSPLTDLTPGEAEELAALVAGFEASELASRVGMHVCKSVLA